jgi:hypothetical protein
VLLGTAYAIFINGQGGNLDGAKLMLFYFFAPVTLLVIIMRSGESIQYGLIAIFQLFLLLLIWLLLWLSLILVSKLGFQKKST